MTTYPVLLLFGFYMSKVHRGIYPIDSTVFRIAQRSFQNAAWTAPLASNVFTREDILLSQPNMNYTAYDYEKLFADLNYTFGWEMSTLSPPQTRQTLPRVGLVRVNLRVETQDRLCWASPSALKDQSICRRECSK